MYNALRDDDKKWILRDEDGNIVVPYIITGFYDNSAKNTIKEAMRRIEKNTCIRFKKRLNETDYLDFQNVKYEGCYADSVGRRPGKNIVTLEYNGGRKCLKTHVVQHELFHVLGLWHEHMRSDRDKYITVNYRNVDEDRRKQFEKVSDRVATTFGIPYNYKSLMHYQKTAFTKRGLISIQTKDKTYQDVIGTAKDAAPSDYRKICLMYKCRKCMGGM
ncbi:hypothetical protein Q1695_008742 [Nippostrongylus brasiliensis]|nr:hypothetical protein Q1695_008742 [Nippostrongylus brasiliensis]